MALNDKQKRFAIEYLTDKNATKAAIRAGYSPKTAYSQGNRLLKNDEINEFINRKEKKQLERVEISQEEVLMEIKKNAMKEANDSTYSEFKHSSKTKYLDMLCKCMGLYDRREPDADYGTEVEEDPLSKALREEAEALDNADQ